MASIDNVPAELGRVGGTATGGCDTCGVSVSEFARAEGIPLGLLTDRLVIRNVNAPNFAAPGNAVRIEVVVEGQAPIGTDAEGVVTFTRADTGETVRQPADGVRAIGRGQRVSFTHSFVMPDSAVVIEIRALERDVGVLRVTDSASVRVGASRAAAGLNPLVTLGPWLAGGGAVGAGAAHFTDRPLATGAGAGAAVGLGAGFAINQIEGPILPQFPTTAVLATAALLGGGVLLLRNLPALRTLGAARQLRELV